MSNLFYISEDLKDKGYNVFYIGLYGSQNYGLDTDESDFDYKAIIIPNLDQLCRNEIIKPFKIEYDFGEVDVRDIREVVDLWIGGRIQYLEILGSSDYRYHKDFIDLVSEMRKNINKIAYIDKGTVFKTICRYSTEKVYTLEYPYPKVKARIDKFGYDPKQLSHIIRLNVVAKRLAEGTKFSETINCPAFVDGLDMLGIKQGRLTVKEAREIAKRYHENTVATLSALPIGLADEKTKKWLFDWMVKVIKKSVEKEIVL